MMSMDNVFHQNSFSRAIANDAKLGAYYTDVKHCERIGYLFDFPEDEDVCVLDPSIGDGYAVVAATGKKAGDRKHIFGVELNSETFKLFLEDNALIEYPLCADFLNGVIITHGAFSFMFANPPYGQEGDSKRRLEVMFAEKAWNYLSNRAFVAYVIPYGVLTNENFIKPFFARFQCLAVFRFDDKEYERFHQVVIIAQKRSCIGYLKSTFDDFYATIDSVEKLPYLPNDIPEKRIRVSPSSPDAVEYFTTLQFNRKAAAEHLRNSPLHNRNFLREHAFMQPFVSLDIGQPPMPLKKDLLYLTAIAGGGQGLAGSEEKGDVHLQRGVTKVVKKKELRKDEVTGKETLVEVQTARVSMNIIESDGTITELT